MDRLSSSGRQSGKRGIKIKLNVFNNLFQGVNPVHFRQLVQQNRLLTLNRFRLYCGIYADQYSSCLKKIVTRLRQTVPVLFDEYTAEVNMLLSVGAFLFEQNRESV